MSNTGAPSPAAPQPCASDWRPQASSRSPATGHGRDPAARRPSCGCRSIRQRRSSGFSKPAHDRRGGPRASPWPLSGGFGARFGGSGCLLQSARLRESLRSRERPATSPDPGNPEPRIPRDSLPATLAAQHGAWGLDDSGESPACLLITAGRSPENKLVALTFNSGGSEPRIAVKLPRVPKAEAGLEHEAAVLHAAHAERARSGIPRLIARATIAGRIALAESVVTGRPLLDLLARDSHRTLCLKVTDFLADLATDAPRRRSTAWRESIAEVALQALSPAEQQRARAILAQLGPLPEVFEQRDCSPWNVLVQRDGTLALLDWESAEERGLPGLDLVYFLSYAGFLVDGTMHTGGEIASYRRMLTPTTLTGGAYAECTAMYAERVGFDQSTLPPLRLLCWLVHARSAQLRAQTETMGAPQDGSLFLELARHELARHEA